MTATPRVLLIKAALEIGPQLRGRRPDAIECHLLEDSRTVLVEAFRGDERIGTTHVHLPQPTACIDHHAWQQYLMELFAIKVSQFAFACPVAFSLDENPDARDTPS